MTPDTVLKLADFEFSRFEIPERIPFGGRHLLAVHKMIGGKRVIDAMGRDDAPLSWSGLIQGQNATLRARYLDGLRISGQAQALFWGDFKYKVVVEEFVADYERFYQIPYRISCLVEEDQTNLITSVAGAGIDDLIAEDMNAANGLGDLIGDGPLSDLLGALDSAIGAVSSFANAAQSVINSVLQPLAMVQSRVGILISSVGNTVANVGTLGGVLPNNPISMQASRLLGQVTAMTQLPQLYNLQSVLGRMGGNLGSIGAGTSTITSAGGNLFGMAADAYGDATAWTTLARANGLFDPILSGVNSINIPPIPDISGGVLEV